MDISGLMSNYDTTTASANGTELEKTLSSDLKDASDAELLDACKQFEQYFLEQIMKQMVESVKMGADDDTTSSSMSSMKSYISDGMVEQYAGIMTESNDGEGIGLAQQLYESMKRNYGSSANVQKTTEE